MADIKMTLSKQIAQRYVTDEYNKRVNILKKIGVDPDKIPAIAGMNFNDVKNITTMMEDTILAMGQYSKEYSKPMFGDDSPVGKAVYSNLHKNGVLDFLRTDTSTLLKTQSGKDLMNKTVLNNINYNRTMRKGMADFQDVNESMHNFADIMKNGGQVVSYDLETLGGTNAKGHQQVDFITEFAAMVHDIGPDGKVTLNKDKSMSTLAGFSQDEYEKVKNYVKGLEGRTPGELTSKDNVYIHRLSLLSDPRFKYGQGETNGFEFKVLPSTANPDDVVDSIDNALKGLDKYREIGIKQESWLQQQGIAKSLTEYKYDYAEKVSKLVHGHEGLSERAISLAHNSFNFDDPMFGITLGKNIEHKFGKGVDSLQAMRYIQEHFGIGSHIPKGYHTTNEFGPTAQDQLKKMFRLDKSGVAAHNAEEDSLTLFNIFNKKINKRGDTYLDFILDKTKAVNDKLVDLKNMSPIEGLTGRKPIFLMDKTGQKEWGVNKGGLSFAYNPMDKSYKTQDGFRIDANGNITKENINGFGPKAGALYTHDYKEIELDHKNWKEQFTNLGLGVSDEQYYQQYSSLDKLYVMRSKEYRDQTAAARKFGANTAFNDPTEYVTILTNKSQIATASGTLVGRKTKDGDAAWDYNVLNGLNLQTTSLDEKGRVVINSVSGDEAGKMLIDRSLVRTSAESAARTIREMPYERAAKLHNYAKSKSKQEAHRISDTISQMVAANKTGDIKTSQKLMGQLVSVLGYKNSVTGKMELKPETIGKSTILDNYTEALSPILDIMEDIFNNDMKLGYKNAKNSKTIKAKKDVIFQNVLTNLLEDMSQGMTPGAQTQLLSNSVAGVFTADELNKVDFLRSDIFPKVSAQMMGTTVAGDNSKYASLDLSKDTGLLNMFYGNKFKNIDELKTGNAGFTALNDAYDVIGSDERFKGVWGNLTRKDLFKYQDKRNLVELNGEMTRRLQTFVANKRTEEGNSGFGLKFARNIQDYTNVTDLRNMVQNAFSTEDGRKTITDQIRELMNGKKKLDVVMADGSDSKLINKIVDKYFMTFSKDDLEQGIQGLGHSQQQWMRAQYGFSKQSSHDIVSDLLDSIKGTNITLGVQGAGTDAKMFLKQGGKKQFIDMHQFVLNNGVINHRINDIDYATSFAYNVNKIVGRNNKVSDSFNPHNTLENIKITSNVQNALGKSRSFVDSAYGAKKRQEDIMDAIVYANKSKNKLLREAGAMKQHNNFANTMKRAMYIDTNPIISILPELKDASVITELEKKHFVKGETSAAFSSLIEKIRKGKIRPDQINDLLANEQNLYFHQYINPLLDAINKQASLGTVDNISVKELIKSLNPHTQDTKLAAGVMSVDGEAFAHGMAKFDKTGRSVSIQTENQILYEREQLAADIKKYGVKDVSVGGKLMTSAGDKYLNHNGKLTSGLTMKYMQIDSNNLKGLFIDDVEKVRKGESNRFSKYLKSAYAGASKEDIQSASTILAERVMSFSTYQQQSIMESRTHYAAFHKNNVQTLNSKKQMIIEHTENVEVIAAMNKADKLGFTIDSAGNVKYQLGYEVDKNEVLGMFGTESNIERAKYTGVFRGRMFDKDGNIMTDAELTNYVKVNKLIGKSEKTIKEHMAKNNLDYKYQVIKKYEDFGHKIANDASEKSTVDTMDIAFGTVDKGLVKELDRHGLTGLKGKYLSRDYIEQYIAPKLGKDANTIIDRMLKERFILSDTIQEMFPKLKGISQYTSLESSKHESISMAVTNIVERISRNKNLSEDKKKALHKELFEGKISYGADGTIITDGITKINTDVKDTYLKAIVNSKYLVRNEKGEIIGHTGYSHVTQIHDYEGGTYASNLDVTSLKKQQYNIEDKIFKLNKKTDLTGEEQEQLIAHIADKNAIEAQLGSLGHQKGIKFDNRANLNLQKSVWNNDSLSLTRDNFKDKKEFEKYFGHVLNLDEKTSREYLGKSMLDPVTSVMRDRTLIGFGETQLSSLAGKDRKTYNHLLESYGSIADRISVEKAEKLYSLQQGLRAIDFNTKDFSHERYTALLNHGEHGYNKFKEIDLGANKHKPLNKQEWLNLDVGGQGNTVAHAENNPYTKNIMIKTGLGGNEEHLAIARMPERHFEENLIKTSHIKKLNQLQTILKEINGGNLGEELESKQSYARQLVNDIKQAQIHDVTSKYGLAGDLTSSRLSQSFFGKASSITYNYNKAFGEDSYEELKKLNGHSFLDKAQFDGKSLLEHYSEGKAIDAVAFSEEAAESMGYFTEKMMKQAGARDKDHMIEILSTKGDSFLTTRFPRNQEASDKVTMGYLDTSLRGNQMKAVGHTGASMKMDHDGDEFGIGRLTNTKGESLLTMADNSTDHFITSQKAMLMERAVNDNRYWDETIRDRVENVEGKIARSGSSIQDVAKKRIIDNKIYSAIMNSEDSQRYETLLNKDDGFYGDLVGKAMGYKGDGDAHAENIEAIKEKFKGNQKGMQKAKEDYVDAYRYQLYKDEFIAKSSKNSIGESNVTNLKIKQIYMGTADKTALDYNYKSSLVYNMMYLTEEAAISSKSSIKGLDPNRAKEWNTHAKDLVLSRGNAQEHVEAMKDWTQKYVVGDIDYNYYWNKSKVFQNIAAETMNNGKSLTKSTFDDLMKNETHKTNMQNRLVNDFVDSIASLRNVDHVKEFYKYTSVGQSTTGVKDGILNATRLGNFENTSDGFIKAQEAAHEDINSIMRFLSVDSKVKSSRFGGPSLVENLESNVEELETKSSIGRQVLEGASDLFKGVTGSKIAMGAVGIAAGVMMLGYVGGRPRPAETQAMEEAQDYQEPQSGSLMDPGMMPQSMSMGGQSGYVININARSDKGRSHAVSAIQQAISAGTSSNVNISMNINDNYGNMNDRDIQKAIKDAL